MKAMKFLPFIVAATVLVGCGQKSAPTADANQEKPAAAAASAAATAAPAAVAAAPAAAPSKVSAADLAKGEQVFGANCVSCHGAGVLGAPKVGDKGAWQPRIAKGADALYASGLNGLKMMPARGGNAALKDEEIKAAVDFMMSKAS
jgi:cytochrome c5